MVVLENVPELEVPHHALEHRISYKPVVKRKGDKPTKEGYRPWGLFFCSSINGDSC